MRSRSDERMKGEMEKGEGKESSTRGGNALLISEILFMVPGSLF
jgi:hypothetical protein